MPHFAKPYFRPKRGTWYVQIDGHEHKLGHDKVEAFRRYHAMMSRPPEDRAEKPVAAPQLVIEVLDAFLDWVKANREPRTFDWYRERLQIFADSIPDGLAVAELKPYHVSRVLAERGAAWTNNGKHNLARAVQRAFRWASKEELIERNPVANVEKPPMEARDLYVTPTDYEKAIEAVTEPNFRDVIRFAWESGARPQEIIAIETRHIDFEQMRVVFARKESKGKKAIRVVYLTPEAAAILKPLAEQHTGGAVFRNTRGRPWTPDAINCAFCRLGKKIGKKLHLGAFRKGWTTEALKNGLDTLTTAHLLGHANGVMVGRIYGKVQQDPSFMAEAMRRAKGVKNGEGV
jgi:integrase